MLSIIEMVCAILASIIVILFSFCLSQHLFSQYEKIIAKKAKIIQEEREIENQINDMVQIVKAKDNTIESIEKRCYEIKDLSYKIKGR